MRRLMAQERIKKGEVDLGKSGRYESSIIYPVRRYVFTSISSSFWLIFCGLSSRFTSLFFPDLYFGFLLLTFK